MADPLPTGHYHPHGAKCYLRAVGQFFSGVLSILTTLGVLFFFGWLVRGLLGARELTWRRLILATVAGFSLGDVVAVFLIARDISDLEQIELSDLYGIALPFQLVATMGAIVVLELLFSRPRRPRRGRLLRPFRALRLAVGIAGRAWDVSRITARYGLAPLIGLRRGRASVHSAEELARRARLAFEEAGGMFIKLGQLLATRPDLVPPEAQRELARLHSSAAPVSREVIEQRLEEELGRPVAEVFAEVDWNPLGSASIAQAHTAVLRDGGRVVVKVRRPGLIEVVERDLAITRWLARTAWRRTTWGKDFDVEGLAGEFADALHDELDFRIEARNLAEVAAAVEDDPLVHVPRVFEELTHDGVLVMEELAGTPLSQLAPTRQVDGEALADALCTSQVAAMMRGDRFHGDPHPGNILLLDDGRLGLIDLGISGRLDAFERASVFQMLVAIRFEQPTLLYEAMVSIGAVDAGVHDPDVIERALARFMAAYLGPGLPPPEALTDLLRLTTELGLRMPKSTTAMFRALATLTGTLEHMSPSYPVIEVIADLGGDELRSRMAPESATDFFQQQWAELAPLVGRLPRHVDRISTMLEHGRLTTRIRLFGDFEERQFIERMLNRGVLTLLAIGSGVVSVMLLAVEDDPVFAFFGTVGLFEAVGWIGLFIAVTLLLRVLLAVLRSESEARPR